MPQRELRKRKAIPNEDYPQKRDMQGPPPPQSMDYQRVARVYANLWSWCQYIYYSANEAQAACKIYPTRRILADFFPYQIDRQSFPSTAADVIISQLSHYDLNLLVRTHIETLLRNGVPLFDELLTLTTCLNLTIKKSVKKLTSIESLVDLILEIRATTKMMLLYDDRNEPVHRIDSLAGASNFPNLVLLKAALYQKLLDDIQDVRIEFAFYHVINTYRLDETSFLMLIDIMNRAKGYEINTNFVPSYLRGSKNIYARLAKYNLLHIIPEFRLPESMLEDRPFMLQILGDNPAYYERLPLTMEMDPEIVFLVLSRDVDLIFVMPREIQTNSDVLSYAVSRQGRTLRVGTFTQRNDLDLIKLALITYGDALQYVHDSLLYNKDLLMFAIARSPQIAITYVPDDIEEPEMYVAAAFRLVQGQGNLNQLKHNISATLLARAIANYEAQSSKLHAPQLTTNF